MSGDHLKGTDLERLNEAARLARKGKGRVEPNPMVGALVVKDGEVLARGYHAGYGGPHAEIHALRRAGARAAGSTLYVTLEPCCSRGKTPPCTDAILEAKVGEVVAGAIDPDPRHQGKGLALLREKGLAVRLAKEEACGALAQEFQVRLGWARPYIILKWAMTLDGRIAARDGSSRWISGGESRRWVHRERGQADAVLVGSRTVELDDPHLNCRLRRAPRIPARVVLDPWLDVPDTARLVKEAGARKDREGYPAGPVRILCSRRARPERMDRMRDRGVELILLDSDPGGGRLFLEEALSALKERGVHRLLVEGGSGVFTSLIEAELADQVMVFIAPKIVGGEDALPPVAGRGRAAMAEAYPLSDLRIRRAGEDAFMEGFFNWPGSSSS